MDIKSGRITEKEETKNKNYIRTDITNVSVEEIENIPYIKDAKQYKKDLAKYEKDFELYEQTKFIRLIKNASEEYILKKYKIIKKD